MKRVFGQFNPDKGEGLLRPVTFPNLMTMDKMTGDDRMFLSPGNSRDLPLSIMIQTETRPGHDGAFVAGTLQEVTFGEDGVLSGRGWLADTQQVRDVMPLLVSKSLRHNSVDLADATVEIKWKSDDPLSPDFWDYELHFPTWSLAATTILSVPAFADARVVLDEELTAALTADTELVLDFDQTDITFGGQTYDELVAALTGAPPNIQADWDDFHIPENPDSPTPICVDADGRVFGNLADWEKPHRGNGQFCPRPSSYDSFNKANAILTEKGFVATGPIFFLGGHPDKPIGNGDPTAAYGGVENGWADVHVSDGKWGPWISGRVRPGLTDEALYVARASNISGHWTADRSKLLAIVSCNVPAFEVVPTVPGTTLRADRTGVQLSNDGEVLELVASLHTPRMSPEAQAGGPHVTSTTTSSGGSMTGNLNIVPTVTFPAGADVNDIAQRVAERVRQSLSANSDVTVEVSEETAVEVAVGVDDEAERLALELELDELDALDS